MVINRVIPSFQDVEDMEKINKMTGLYEFETDNWCDKEQFELHPELKKYISEEEFEQLKNGNADYIAFRLDRG